MSRIDARLAELGITLPEPVAPVANYVPFVVSGNQVYISGQVSIGTDGLITGKLGADWKRWGTEQVTSNYLVANAAGTTVLPFPKYGTPDCARAETAFLHFIGSMRFVNSKYETTSRDAIRLLTRAAS